MLTVSHLLHTILGYRRGHSFDFFSKTQDYLVFCQSVPQYSKICILLCFQENKNKSKSKRNIH